MFEAHRPEVEVITAGTHVVDGHPVSRRTREALATVGFEATGHRSAQLRPPDLPATDVVVAMANEHVEWIRRRHPEAADRTITLHRLVRDLTPAEQPFPERLGLLRPATIELEAWEEVADPAGGELPEYLACARELDRLVRRLAALA